MTDVTGNQPRSGRIFLTLQQGERLRCLALSPVFFFILAAAAGLLLAGSLAQTALMLLRDAARPSLAEAEAAGPSVRISDLQSEVERLTSRNAIAANLIDKRLRELAARQAELEAQALTLGALSAGAPPTEPAPADDPAEAAPVRLRKLDGAMNLLGGRNTRAVAALGARRLAEARRIEAALKAAGVNAGAVQAASAPAAGGPFAPLAEHFADRDFAAALRNAEPALMRHAELIARVAALPLRAPLAGPYETSSDFGARMDPFHGRAAWHSGVDLRSETGDDVRATASGQVVNAGWNGSYGLMVEIDHDGGTVTRYGHLSRTLAREGRRVEAGSLIGRSGSTGRSTGAHLHYEIRVNGEAVDPARYLRAGETIANLLDTRSRPRELAQLSSN